MKKLTLGKETIRRLDSFALDDIRGGGNPTLKCPDNKGSHVMYETSVDCCKRTADPDTV